MKNLILNTANTNAISNKAVKNGMITLGRDGTDKVLTEITTIEEVYRVTNE